MNYAETDVSKRYDKARRLSSSTMSLWLDAIDRYIEADEKISIILDLGCGTGRFSTALALWFDASVVAMREFRRVLRHGGILCIRNSTTDLVIDFDI